MYIILLYFGSYILVDLVYLFGFFFYLLYICIYIYIYIYIHIIYIYICIREKAQIKILNKLKYTIQSKNITKLDYASSHGGLEYDRTRKKDAFHCV